MFRNHPPGLKVLFFTEMWERFAFYLMLGIFFLYMVEPSAGGGLGFGTAQANEVYGWFIALVYLTPFVGGILADVRLGYRRSIVIGAVLMAAGYMGIGLLPGLPAFYVSLAVVIVGNGFFKPNISSLVGRLYRDNGSLKDAGYNLFYMGINIGAFVCNFVAAFLRHRYGWGWAFVAAGVGLLVGTLVFLRGQPRLVGVDDRGDGSAVQPGVLGRIVLQILIPAVAAGLAGYGLATLLRFDRALAFFTPANTAFVFAVIPIVIYYLGLRARAPRAEKGPIGALLAICGVVIVFWMIFHQNGNTLTMWAKSHTDRDAGAAAPILEVLHVDEHASAAYYDGVPPAEVPEEKPVLVSTELFQSVNPMFVVLLTPIVVWFFGMLRRRRREPSTPAKIAWGLVITGVSTLIMVLAVTRTHGGAAKASPMWLVATYGVITVGELFLSPMGLSLVSKLSPARVTGLMMGGWFLSTSIGNKMSGVIGGLWEKVPLRWIFLINCASALLAALGIALMVPWIKRVMKENDDHRAAVEAAEREEQERAAPPREPVPETP